MEGREGQIGTTPARYTLPPSRFASEDIMFCIDVDNESLVEMKGTGPTGRPYTRLDSIKQAILLFMHAKLSINPDHRFSFTSIGKVAFWMLLAKYLKYYHTMHLMHKTDQVKPVNHHLTSERVRSDIDSAIAAFRGSMSIPSSSQVDLTQLFRAAAHEAKKSRAQNRTLRVILLYCRSSVPPQHQWPANQKLFTLDVMYLHDKPGPENCPQKVYDALVDTLEQVSEYEGYIFESGQGLTRILFRHMCVLLSHPQQRCVQDDIDIPKSLTKKATNN